MLFYFEGDELKTIAQVKKDQLVCKANCPQEQMIWCKDLGINPSSGER